MSKISEYKERFPLYKDIRDDKLAEVLYDKTPLYNKVDRTDFIRSVVGINTEDTPPPDESVIGQVKEAVNPTIKEPNVSRADELPLGIRDTPHAKAMEILAKSFNTYEAALTLGIRKTLGLEVPVNVTEAIEAPRESKSIGDLANRLTGTEDMISDVVDEVVPEAKGGPLEILPEEMFGIPTAEIPKEALKEFADLTGLVVNPKQVFAFISSTANNPNPTIPDSLIVKLSGRGL